MILVKKCPFFLYLCSVKTRQEIVLTDFVDKKETFFDYCQKSCFSKGVNPCFWTNNAIFFFICFRSKKGLEIRLNDVLNRKQTFSDWKNKTFQRLRNGIFPKRLTHAFGQKMQFFSLLFPVEMRLEIMLYKVWDRKHTFFDNKNKTFLSLKNGIFPKRLTHAFPQKVKIYFICFRSKKE